jgi:predicted nucleic acid-binding Zn ribbon protein
VQTQEAPPAPPAAGERATCPSCGKPVERNQPFCLECGRRIAHEYRRPPNWRIPIALVALLVIVVGAAAGFGITELTEQDEGPETITVRTGPDGATAADPGEAPTAAAPTPPAAQPPPSTPATPTTPAEPTQPSGKPAAWPAGEEAYTVVLLSTKDRGTADQTADRAAKAGQPAGVLPSDDYKRFEPGVFVVFAGQFDTVEAASEEARQLTGDYPGAYARFIEPK